MKKLVVTVLIIGGCLYFVKKSSLFSYASTIWAQVKTETKKAVPTRFEIARARHEIANLDGDIDAMIHPIAEYKAAIGRLKKDISHADQTLAQQKEVLLAMTGDLDGAAKTLVYAGEEFSVERVRTKLDKDFAAYKRMEANVKSQRKLLTAKETALKATEEQLAKLVAKKREYEVRLGQLEADEETLQAARLGSKLQIDDSRATQIEAALTEIERRQEVQRAEVELRTGTFVQEGIPVKEKALDLPAMRAYLHGAK
jgi:chromosome segregation ATPase